MIMEMNKREISKIKTKRDIRMTLRNPKTMIAINLRRVRSKEDRIRMQRMRNRIRPARNHKTTMRSSRKNSCPIYPTKEESPPHL